MKEVIIELTKPLPEVMPELSGWIYDEAEKRARALVKDGPMLVWLSLDGVAVGGMMLEARHVD